MIGLGVASFSYFGGVNYQNVHNVEEYLRVLDTDQLQLWRSVELTPKQLLIREMILQLKTGRLDTGYFKRKFQSDIWQEFQSIYEQLEKDDLLHRDGATIVLTRRGLLRVDHFLSDFFEPELNTVQYV